MKDTSGLDRDNLFAFSSPIIGSILIGCVVVTTTACTQEALDARTSLTFEQREDYLNRIKNNPYGIKYTGINPTYLVRIFQRVSIMPLNTEGKGHTEIMDILRQRQGGSDIHIFFDRRDNTWKWEHSKHDLVNDLPIFMAPNI